MFSTLIEDMYRKIDRITLYNDSPDKVEYVNELQGWIKRLQLLEEKLDEQFVNLSDFTALREENEENYNTISALTSQLNAIKRFIGDIDIYDKC